MREVNFMRRGLPVVAVAVAVLAGACAGSPRSEAKTPAKAKSAEAPASEAPAAEVRSVHRGKASWYGRKFHGRKTASGERFDMRAQTAAHRRLPFGTRVRVTNLENGRVVVVRVNDRGPFSGGRIIDLSRAAAKRLRMIQSGVVPVKLEVLAR